MPFELGYKRELVEIFRRTMKHGQVIELHDSDHFFFQDAKQGDGAAWSILSFLAGQQ